MTEAKQADHTLIRERVDANHSSQRPHQEIWIEMLVGEIFARPPVSPRPQRLDYRTELPPRFGQSIFVAVAVLCIQLLDDSTLLKGVQTLREQVPRDPGQPAVKVVESAAAQEQLTQDEWRPALGEDLRAHGDGAELTVARHGSQAASRVDAWQVQIVNCGGV